MHTLTKFLLGPVLLIQGRRVRNTALRLPEAAGPRSGVIGDAQNPLRILFVGDSSAAGVGVREQQLAWAQPAAEAVARMADRAVAWQLVARSGVNTREALALLKAAPVQPADVLVTALGVNDVTSQRSARQFIDDTLALHDWVREHCGARLVVRVGIPPMDRFTALPQPLRWYLGQCATRLDAALNAELAGRAGVNFINLRDPALAAVGELAEDGYHPGPLQYRAMAQTTAREVMALL